MRRAEEEEEEDCDETEILFKMARWPTPSRGCSCLLSLQCQASEHAHNLHTHTELLFYTCLICIVGSQVLHLSALFYRPACQLHLPTLTRKEPRYQNCGKVLSKQYCRRRQILLTSCQLCQELFALCKVAQLKWSLDTVFMSC